jgi:hypothetical protein
MESSQNQKQLKDTQVSPFQVHTVLVSKFLTLPGFHHS